MRILDLTGHTLDGRIRLLDGQGKFLPDGAEPVYLEISQEEFDAGTAKNSRGEAFSPPYPPPMPIIVHNP